MQARANVAHVDGGTLVDGVGVQLPPVAVATENRIDVMPASQAALMRVHTPGAKRSLSQAAVAMQSDPGKNESSAAEHSTLCGPWHWQPQFAASAVSVAWPS